VILDVLEYLLPLLPSSLLSAPNEAGSTPLHWAAVNKHLPAMRTLVGHAPGPGAALVLVRDAAGRSPLGEAELAGWDDGARWLVEQMELADSAQPQSTDEPVPEADDDGAEGEEITLSASAKPGKDGRPVQVEIVDADGRMASMTLDDPRHLES
jgi:hypothetical protein